MMIDSNIDQTIFLTMVRTVSGKSMVRLLIESIRAFGGGLRECPIWLFEANPQDVPCDSVASEGVQVFPLNIPDAVNRYYFADKVYACARAEEMVSQNVQTLIWVDPTCLVIRPPLLFDLGESMDAAVRPVHIQNVGLLSSQSVDDFWKRVYEVVGVSDIQMSVETFVGAERIRAYFNSHAFAIRPSTGLLGWWFECFQRLVCDEEYQKDACHDDLHQIFLHQAILSAALVARLESERIRILPPEYNYPYNLHSSVPKERRAEALNDLVCITYEGRDIDPWRVDDIKINEPLRSWLSTRVASN
jgi:hypothetical protein